MQGNKAGGRRTMNVRERFLAVMNFEPVDRTLFWEMGFGRIPLSGGIKRDFPRARISPKG
jgi:hypothetical protein